MVGQGCLIHVPMYFGSQMWQVVYKAEVEKHACLSMSYMICWPVVSLCPAGRICQPDAEVEGDANAEGRGTGGRLVYGGAHGERPWVLKVPCRAKYLLPIAWGFGSHVDICGFLVF